MAIFEITRDKIRPIDETTFEKVSLSERGDLQRLLRRQIDVISPDTLIISEEFCEWDDSKRRIDLLGVDKDANLVVFELKRTEDGGHMELQAIRYASMVAAMTFEKAVEVYERHLNCMGEQGNALPKLLAFLGWDEPDEDRFAQDVKIVLVSAEFSKELTTAVMWLNEHELNIRCVRLKPYSDGNRVLVDVQQVIPLPEAENYQIRIREKEGRERMARREQSELGKLLYRFWTELLQRARLRTNLHARISPSTGTWIAAGAGVGGLSFNYAFGRKTPRVELYISTADEKENKEIFDKLFAAKEEIEKSFGGRIDWERLDGQKNSRISADLGSGSVRDEANWKELEDKLIDFMIRLESAVSVTWIVSPETIFDLTPLNDLH